MINVPDYDTTILFKQDTGVPKPVISSEQKKTRVETENYYFEVRA